MNNKLIEFLYFIGLEESEIEELVESCPGLKIRKFESIVRCAAAVTANGFPKSELPSLIKLNPNFLLGKPEHISQFLSHITGDIRMELLKNPYII